jgi:hypothetical protein
MAHAEGVANHSRLHRVQALGFDRLLAIQVNQSVSDSKGTAKEQALAHRVVVSVGYAAGENRALQLAVFGDEIGIAREHVLELPEPANLIG